MRLKLIILLILIYPLQSFAEGFKESFLNISLLGSFIGYSEGGELLNKEAELNKDYSGNDKTTTILSGDEFCFQLCIYIPYSIQLNKENTLKFGMKIASGIIKFTEEVGENEDDSELSSQLLEYSYNSIGPLFIINLTGDLCDIGMQFYSLYGHIDHGTLKAVPWMRDQGYVLNKSDYKSGLKGYNIQIGISPYCAINNYHVILMGDLHYTFSHIEIDKKLPIYGDYDGNSNLHAYEFGIGIGLYF